MTLDPDALTSPTMTFVSRCGPATRGIRACISWLVRSSHGCSSAVLALLASGCLFPEPPNWDPKPGPPVLKDPSPSTTAFVPVSRTTTAANSQVTLSATESSEDEGHTLRALWYRDQFVYMNSFDIPPGHIDTPKPLISYEIQGVTFQPGCVPITLLVTHIENVSNQPDHLPLKLKSGDPEFSDVAMVTWWLYVADSISTTSIPLSSCPGG